MRHGQSMWNANLFTGWVDVPLTQVGIDEAIAGGKKLADVQIDEVHTSTLIRAQMTAMLALSQHKSGKTPVLQYVDSGDSMSENEQKMVEWSQMHDDADASNILPVYVSWQLNERMYGDLQGMNKQATRDKFGDDQVKIWRRSYDTPPPNGESLALTRLAPSLTWNPFCYLDMSRTRISLFAAHGNSLRSIIMHLEGLSKEEVLGLEVPTGVPMIYELHDGQWKRTMG